MDSSEPLTEREILAILDSYAQSSISTRSSELSKERAKALDYYNMRAYGDENSKLGSTAVTSEVFDAVETIHTRLMKVFTSTDKAVEFVPEGPEDVEAADQKTKYANHIFYRKNNGFLVLYETIKNGLLMKNGIIKVYPEEDVSVKSASYRGLTETQAAMLATEEGTEFVGANVERDPVDGSLLFDLDVKHVEKKVNICVESIAPEQIKISGWHNSVLLDKADYIEHRSRVSVSRLRELGLVGQDEDVHSLGGASFDEDDSGEEELARDTEIDEQRLFRDAHPLQQEMWRVRVKDILARVDVDGDGIAERRHFIRIGNSIRLNEPTEYCGYGVFAPIIMPHRFVGKCPADLMIHWQRVQSELLRQMLNNIYLSNQGRPIVLQQGNTPQVDMDSLMTAGPGKPIYEKVAGAIRWDTPPQIAEQIISVSEQVRQQGETRTGLTRLTRTSMNPNAITKTATGASLVDQNENEREELLCRVFAETCLKPVMAAIAHLARKYQDRKQMIRQYNKFIEVDPSYWSENDDMAINVGLGTGTARQTTENIEKMMAVQQQIIAGGGLGAIVTPENIFHTASKHAESIGFKDSSGYYTDPSTVEPPPKEPSIEEKQLETLERIEQLKALLKKFEIEVNSKDAADKNSVELMKAALEGRIRMEIESMNTGAKFAHIGADVEKADRKNKTDTEIAVMEAIAKVDGDDTREKAALELEERRAKGALELEDKKVVSMKRGPNKEAKQYNPRTKKIKIKSLPNGSYESEDDESGSKVRIMPLDDGGFETELIRERRGTERRAKGEK